MKLNNKGFAISSVMYALLILAVSLMFGIIAILVSRKMTLDQVKNEVKKDINGEIINTPTEYKGIEYKDYEIGDEISYAGLNWQVVSDNDDSVTVVLNKTVLLSTTGVSYSDYSDLLHAWAESNSVLSMAIKNDYLVLMDFSDGIGTYNDYIRIMQASDIYGTNPIPTTYSSASSLIKNCNICNMKTDYMLLNKVSASEALLVKYDDSNLVNYLMKTTTFERVRPVITIKKY